ncbi:MAG: EAL domain-containing protein, partial [Lachnospiraceae bacterium]|nr:EAL domain-containing protein [Lachnospiraceae bacterium]
EIAQIQVWYLQELGTLKVYVLQNIILHSNDFFSLMASTFLFGIMIAIFIVYYLLSFVGVIVSMHKTTKVIYTDMITGGNNWLYFEKRGEKLLKKKSASSEYAVIHLKMRKYRSFCTCFGVKEGEVLIEKLYYALKRNLARKEVMAYKENASFGLLLCYKDELQLCQRLEKMMEMLDKVLPNMNLYFSVGVYKVQRKERDLDQLYNNALLACDMLGEENENKIVFFDVEMNKRRMWERKVEDDMDKALAHHEFQVYLQPKISASEETLAGAEALVRWIHPKEGFIPPNKFIPIFERNGFILKLDDYMLEEIAKQQASWIAEGRKIVPISVNISRAHFAKEDLAEHICRIVDKYQVPHQVIELELTESAFFDDKEILLQTVKKLREAGFIVSMDDFGAGYSSLNSLKELQLDVLKLDADFFRGTDTQERGMLIVSEVIDMAKKLNMKIVAEGIESRDQVDFLVEQECDLIQGYYFAKPMPISDFERRMSIPSTSNV